MSDGVAKRDLEFRDRDALQEWLKTQPREVSVIIAARAALRVLPLAATELPAKEAGRFTALISALFRATALSRVAGKYPTRAKELFAGNAATAARLAADDSVFDSAAAAFRIASRTAVAAADAVDLPSDVYVAWDVALHAAFAAEVAGFSAAAAVDVAAAWAPLSIDANFLEAGGTVADLADRRLWPGPTPSWAAELWAKLLAAFPQGEDWDVWGRWYHERLVGARSRGEAYELVFATVPEKVWDIGPAAANRWIKEHLPPEVPTGELPPIENLPVQISAAAQFSEGGTGPIDLGRDPANSDPSELEDQREHYAEARQKALNLQSLGGNFLGDDLQRRMARLLEVMPDDMDALSIVRLWHRANSLRERLADHDQAVEHQSAAAHPEPDPAILAYVAAGPLRDFLKSYNIFIVGDAKGRELDRKSLGPGERERDEAAIAAMEPVIAALRSAPDVATEAVPEILQELSDAAKSAPKSLAGDQDVALARDSAANFIVAAIRKAYRGIKEEPAVIWKGVREGAYREIGKATLGATATAAAVYWPAVAHFIAERRDALKAFAMFVYNNPAIPQMIDAITNFIRGHI